MSLQIAERKNYLADSFLQVAGSYQRYNFCSCKLHEGLSDIIFLPASLQEGLSDIIFVRASLHEGLRDVIFLRASLQEGLRNVFFFPATHKEINGSGEIFLQVIGKDTP